MSRHRHRSFATDTDSAEGREFRGHSGRGGRHGRMFEHGRLRLVLLQLIAAKPAHGYELIKAIEEKTRGAYSPSPGVVYPTLTLLEELGHVLVASNGGRKLYSITPAGESHLAEHSVTLQEMSRRLEIEQRLHTDITLPIEQGMDGLKRALRMHLQDNLSSELALAIAATLQQATQTIEQLKATNTPRTQAMTTSSPERGVQRIRQEVRRRMLTVKRVTKVTPRLLCVTLTGDDLAGFSSPAYDDHIKLFLPAPGSIEPILPKGPPGSALNAEGPQPIMRDYTPRRYDPVINELDVEFVLHSEGPATSWAANVQPGHKLAIGGPRGSSVLQGDFDWYVLVADEAGLPAVARRLAELPAGARVFVIAEVEDRGEEQQFETRTHASVTWVHRNGGAAGTTDQLLPALRNLTVPAGVGYTWIATESNVARALRNYLTSERGFDKQWLKAAGYWKLGEIASHERHDD